MKSPARQYSPVQKEAIETFGKELCVSAGAGSGKTNVLVERFLHAVTKKKIDPERILAITFTEKAANEMKSRLVAECRERGLHDFRRKLETAYISTIHSFCSRLLKENPIEAGVDPFFQVLSAGEAEILMNQTMDRLFEGNSDNTIWLRVLSEFGEEPTRNAIKKFYEMDRAVGGADIFKPRDLSPIKKKTVNQCVGLARDLEGRIEFQKATESEVKLKTAFEDLFKLPDHGTPENWESVERLLNVKENISRRLQKYKEAVAEIHRLLDLWVSLAVEEIGAPIKKEFASFCRQFKVLYDEEKRTRASYDFEDLLVKATELLSGSAIEKKSVREHYRAHFASLLVDEYQDTNPLQDKLIELLKKKDNLFVVGDIQQSIYGFRFADPEMFQRRILAQAPTSRHLRLDENYRSREDILKFINELFKKISDTSMFHPLTAKKMFPSKKTPSVQFLCVLREKEDGTDLDRARVNEARSIASTIKAIADSGVRYRDIAVLFRSLSRSYLYEKELMDLSIPYALAKGGGFYEKPEILDFINFLKLIENPHLDVALAGVLRSPLVCLSDDALFWLADSAKRQDRNASLVLGLDQIQTIKQLTAGDRQKLLDFVRLLADLRKQKNSLKLSEVLEKILRETYYDAKVLTRAGGKQKLANILKLVTLAQSMEEKNIVGIQDFVRYAEHLSENEIVEGEAQITSETENSVTLSTIHAAKGLEFPYVIIADMGRQAHAGKKESFAARPGIGFGLKQKFPKTQAFIKDFTFAELDQILSKKETEEEERLLYVAMTRAQEHLILSGSLVIDRASGSVKKNSSWMSRVAQSLSWDPVKQGSGEIDIGGVAVGILQVKKTAAPTPAPAKGITALPLFSDRQDLIDLRKRLEPVLKDYEETEDHTVTDLLLASRSGLPAIEAFSVEKYKEISQDTWETGTPRNEIGTLFHRMMEYTMLRRKKKIMPADIPLSMIRLLRPAEQKEIKEGVLRFWRGRWGQLAREAKKCYAELPFIYKTQNGILKGQIDLVLQTKAGEWLILDYKTNQIVTGQKEALAKEYEIQLSLYAFVFKRLYGEAPKKGVLYFSAIDESFEFEYTPDRLDAFEVKLKDYFLKASSPRASADAR